MNVDSLEVNLNNPRVLNRVKKIAALEDLDDGTKLTARKVSTKTLAAAIDPGKLSGYDLHVFKLDQVKIVYIVFSFDTPIAWAIFDGSSMIHPIRYITREPISATTERHRDVVRTAWDQPLERLK